MKKITYRLECCKDNDKTTLYYQDKLDAIGMGLFKLKEGCQNCYLITEMMEEIKQDEQHMQGYVKIIADSTSPTLCGLTSSKQGEGLWKIK